MDCGVFAVAGRHLPNWSRFQKATAAETSPSPATAKPPQSITSTSPSPKSITLLPTVTKPTLCPLLQLPLPLWQPPLLWPPTLVMVEVLPSAVSVEEEVLQRFILDLVEEAATRV